MGWRSHATYRTSRGWLFFRRIFNLRKRGLLAYGRSKRWCREIRGIPEIPLKLKFKLPEVAESCTDGRSKIGKAFGIGADGEGDEGAGIEDVGIDIHDKSDGNGLADGGLANGKSDGGSGGDGLADGGLANGGDILDGLGGGGPSDGGKGAGIGIDVRDKLKTDEFGDGGPDGDGSLNANGNGKGVGLDELKTDGFGDGEPDG